MMEHEPKPDVVDNPVHTLLYEGDRERLFAIAEKDGVSISEALRQIVNDYLNERMG